MFFYSLRLLRGEEPDLVPRAPRPAVEDLVPKVSEEQVQSFLERRRRMDKNVNKVPYLPRFQDEQELLKMDRSGLNLARTIFKVGRPENFTAALRRCKENKVTIGALGISLAMFTVAAEWVRTNCPDPALFRGLDGVKIVMSGNMRPYTEPPLTDLDIGYFTTMWQIFGDVYPETRLWELARKVSGRLEEVFREQDHLVYFELVKRGLWDEWMHQKLIFSNLGPYAR